jgi:isoquinoline 1-oxidoreductase beta subunit
MAISRRKLLVGTGLAAGALVVGVGFWPYPQRERERALLGHGKDNAVLNTWIMVSRDNRVTVVVPHQDMGQGSMTALAQMVADELDAEWSLVSVIEAPAHEAFANPNVLKGLVGDYSQSTVGAVVDHFMPKVARAMDVMITGGSSAVRGTGQYTMRPAGAAVRDMLVRAAAAGWKVAPGELTTAESHVLHAASGRKIAYGELIEAAAQLDPPAKPQLKTPDRFTVMGKSVARLDVPDKVNGATKFAIDTRLDGMKYAAIRHSPVFGGTIQGIDKAAVLNRPGVHAVVELPASKPNMLSFGGSDVAVAVVADDTWQAETAVRALPVTFAEGANAGMSTEGMFADFEKAVAGEPAKDLRKQGDTEAALKGAKRLVEAQYRVPFLDHAAMEPHSTTALVRMDGTAEIWTGSQAPLMARTEVAHALGLKADQVVLHNHPIGGGFGRKMQLDSAVQAARIAAAMPGTPVKLTWSREEDIQHGKYRPACLSRFRAALDDEGNPVAWLNVYNWHDDPAALIPYGIANQHIGYVEAKAAVPTGPWRSVGHSRHAFFQESFVDELAQAAGADPYQYRRRLLAHSPRHQAVLDMAAEKGAWGTPLPAGAGRGIAFHESFNSITAQVAEVSTGPGGALRVDRVVCVIDCGTAINPDTVEAQVQGGVLYGLSAALYGEITIKDGRVQQSNFDSYRVLRMADAPRVEAHILQSGAVMGGVGEPGTPAVAPAVANAVFAATGQRMRTLPLNLHQGLPAGRPTET